MRARAHENLMIEVEGRANPRYMVRVNKRINPIIIDVGIDGHSTYRTG